MGEAVISIIIAAVAAAVSLVVTRVLRRWAVTSSRLRAAKSASIIVMAGAALGMAFAVAGPLESQLAEMMFLACAFQFGVFSLLLWQLVGDAEEVEARRMIADDL